ncbi:hypothetical protein A9404_10390 [Halothiobacillus diazotrophicus]|uniref:Zinc-ribbon domain-containing protein n=1 Tax=Halothiobacillus diazotrophicus TaxID=1860122 RepID=A0A191ZIN7_9GAMM|nr:putative zinc-binding peptidase [Halothiobacillus diazotrophicus]ANJ67730.1 hypothetical protein A9404_10390 [Halothiobacillus diazotrophicus]
MKTFACTHCGQPVFFENVYCESCNSPLGFDPGDQTLRAFEIQPDGIWRPLGPDADRRYRPCRNYHEAQVCNWMVRDSDDTVYCRSCRYTAVIPQLDRPENRRYWFLLESAKRRLIYALDQLGLPIPGRDEDPQRGLAFRFLADQRSDHRVVTGHDAGLITVNIVEADDAEREAIRTRLNEPYRTLLGHFRHEIGHFYWELLIADGPRLDEFRALFGDERADYQAALNRYYQSPPPEDWSRSYISAYATMHPWEDWAETWAHYMHIVDALGTARNWGVRIHRAAGRFDDWVDLEGDVGDFRTDIIRVWLPLSQFLNSMNRSLGQKDSYPFVIPDGVIQKLVFIHQVVQDARETAG